MRSLPTAGRSTHPDLMYAERAGEGACGSEHHAAMPMGKRLCPAIMSSVRKSMQDHALPMHFQHPRMNIHA